MGAATLLNAPRLAALVTSRVAAEAERSGPAQGRFTVGEPVLVVALGEPGDAPMKRLLRVTGRPVKVEGVGILDTAGLVGAEPGHTHAIGSRRFAFFRPTARDLMETVQRKAQIVLPKDAAHIILEAGIGPGARVVEAGIGSAALTVALASAVGPTGHVFNYEVRDDFQRFGKANLERADLLGRVTLTLADPTEGIAERDVDATVFDLPEPWRVVPAAAKALRPGGSFAAYTPNVQQMEATVRALREAGFWEIRSREVLTRDWHVGERGVRPEFSMLGHTAWLTFGRAPPA